MSYSYLDDNDFIDFVLEKGFIPFVVRGNVSCFANFNFTPFIGVKISGPTYHVRVFGENLKELDDTTNIFVQELVEEVVFPGEIALPERNKIGVAKALQGLELWADFLCITLGNPKVTVEIQRMIVSIENQYTLDYPSLQRWGNLIEQYFQLAKDERKPLAGVLWWYRKACSTAYYSLFDSYTAYWNCLEILCGVSGSKTNQGTIINSQIQTYLKDKKKITAGHILHCYNNFVNYSIKEQMKDALKSILGDEQATQVIYQCFEIKPDKNRLYQIRNDINHGNIRENSVLDYERIHYRGELLWYIVMMLIRQKLGSPISVGKNINELAEKLKTLELHKDDA